MKQFILPVLLILTMKFAECDAQDLIKIYQLAKSNDPDYKILHLEPRYKKVINQMGLTDYPPLKRTLR